MKFKSRTISILLSVAAMIFLGIVGCGGGGGGGGSAPILPGSADLALTKTVDVATPEVGSDVVFTIVVSNAGPNAATGVVVTDQLPSGFTYFSHNGIGTYDPATGAWSVGTLAVGASQTLTITATVNDTGSYTNRAQVTANEIDPNTNNNFDGAVAAPAGISVTINQIQTACETNTTSDNAYVTVLDQLQNPVTSGVIFTLTESLNSSQNDVTNFSVATNNENSSISLVLDYSLSIFDSGLDVAIKEAAIGFIDQLAPGDAAEIITFNETVNLEQVFTTDKQALKDAIISAAPATAPGTELYNAIILGINNTARQPSTNNRAVVVVTDGRNNVYPPEPNINVDTAIADAQSNQIPVYTIGLGAESDWDELIKLATETKGQFFPSFQSDDITEIYETLANILNSQYVITYASLLPGGASAPGTLTVNADSNGLSGSDTEGYAACP